MPEIQPVHSSCSSDSPSLGCPLASCPLPAYPLIDTHTHFDDVVFATDRRQQAQLAYHAGVRHLLLVGYLARYFDRLVAVHEQLNRPTCAPTPSSASDSTPQAHLAFGLHPAYIHQHSIEDLDKLATHLHSSPAVAIGEIGLDTYLPGLKTPDAIAKQEEFFVRQLDMATEHELPVLLHIRKAHAQALAILKRHHYDPRQLGGIAHSFSGGEQEAKAFVQLGFKLGVTGQVTNPNAKKLRRAITQAVAEYGLGCLVLETDCPDMTPISCQTGESQTRNVPKNLPVVLHSLSELLTVSPETLARQLWANGCEALRVEWQYA